MWTREISKDGSFDLVCRILNVFPEKTGLQPMDTKQKKKIV